MWFKSCDCFSRLNLSADTSIVTVIALDKRAELADWRSAWQNSSCCTSQVSSLTLMSLATSGASQWWCSSHHQVVQFLFWWLENMSSPFCHLPKIVLYFLFLPQSFILHLHFFTCWCKMNAYTKITRCLNNKLHYFILKWYFCITGCFFCSFF